MMAKKSKGAFEYPCRDHLGKEYPSITAMAEAYGVPCLAFRARLRYGWDLERALTTPVMKKTHEVWVSDHKGNKYPSQSAMAEAYGVPCLTFRARLRYGWDLEKALTTPVRSCHSSGSHEGPVASRLRVVTPAKPGRKKEAPEEDEWDLIEG